MPDAAAGPHPFDTAGWQQARRSVGVFISDAALRNVGKSCDSGVWMEPETRERFSLIIDEIKKHEGLQEAAKVRGRHQACDRPVALPTGPFGNSRTRTLFHNDILSFHLVTTLMVTSIFPRVALEYGHIWCAAFTTA